MKVVFLCGGVGKRMFPVSEDKFLLDFLGESLLKHQLLMAHSAGLVDFIIIGNPANSEKLKQISGSISGIRCEYALQNEALGIADALKSAASMLTGEIMVVNPNDVFDASAYTALLEARKSGTATSFMLGYKVNEYFPGGYLAVNEHDELTRIVEKPEPGNEPSNLVNILLHIHSDAKALLEYIGRAQTDKDDVYECAMDNMLKNGLKIKVVRYGGHWSPIKYPWHIFDTVKYFLDAAKKNVPHSVSIASSAELLGKVIIGENVRILENAIIKGPVYIGHNSVVGNNTLIREYSHIGSRCVVGFSSEIKGSYIGDDCWFHSSYIGDSIIGNKCSFGAGTITGNFRFDQQPIVIKYNDTTVNTGRTHFGAIIGDNCKTGINSSILPGRRMGPNSILGSHVCLNNDLEPGIVVAAETHYRFEKRIMP
jgi:UDP-N-acetylglucosamine diphosphorylase / glucose-1-phosphate thymidylyltransferase / UDP-N-acetylgalactosamine diphosphorylase / glucosamine-1-phosphate N-acetyltransferase / galactosamine-1-phosphate N-acetyltransferase